MINDYAVHWLEESVKKIEERNPETIVISAGKTPSGHVHLGILRELIIGDSIRRIFEEKGEKVIYRIFFDSLDAAKRFPPYIDKNYARKYIGQPFALIPSPFDDIKADSYAEYFGKELLNSLPAFGIKVQPIWSHNLYKTSEMKEQIRIGLKKSDLVKKILLEHITHGMKEEAVEDKHKSYETWMPAMVICEKCGCTQKKKKDGTISPNRVIEYFEKEDMVSYECPACGNTGKVSIESGLVKLNWRLDWPAKWSLSPANVFESSGKDHFTKVTGSWDVSTDLCQNVYNSEFPVGLGYEWIRLGSQDMKTSKGIVFMPKAYLRMADPELIRMLILKTNPTRHISFRIEEIALLYDEYMRMERIFYGLDEAEDDKTKKEADYLYPLIKTTKVTKECPSQISFKFLIVMAQLQNIVLLEEILEKAQNLQTIKGIKSKISKKYMKKRLDQTVEWLNHLKEMIKNEKDGKVQKKLRMKASFFEVPDTITDELKNKLDETQKKGMNKLADWLKSIDKLTEQNLKEQMLKIQTELDIKAKVLFQAIYLILINAKKGPRLGNLMELLDLEWLRERFSSI